MPKNAKLDLYTYIDGLRRNCGFSPHDVLNIKDFCNSLDDINIVCHNFDTRGICGVAFEGETNTIVLNSSRTEAEQNFDCGHEFVHLTRHRGQSGGIFQCFASGQNTFVEWEANEGSAQLIVPYQDFIPRFVYCLEEHPAFIVPSLLAEHYGVSEQVINIRLDSLGYEIDQYRNGAQIGEIRLLSRNQCKREGITPTSYSSYCAYADILSGFDAAI